VLAACAKLSDEQLATAMPGAYGSIRDTLEHIIRAEAGYVARMTGNRPQPSFKWEDHPGIAEMAQYNALVGEALLGASASIRPTDLVYEEWQGQNSNIRPWRFSSRSSIMARAPYNITTILVKAATPARSGRLGLSVGARGAVRHAVNVPVMRYMLLRAINAVLAAPSRWR
jgi:hypothetical protein